MEQYSRDYIARIREQQRRIRERQRRFDEADDQDRHLMYLVAALVLLPLLAAWIFQ